MIIYLWVFVFGIEIVYFYSFYFIYFFVFGNSFKLVVEYNFCEKIFLKNCNLLKI